MLGLSTATATGFIVTMIALLMLPGITLVGTSIGYIASGVIRRMTRAQA